MAALHATEPATEGCSAVELRRAVPTIDVKVAVAVLDDLQQRGLVARLRDEDDRRRNLVELTAAGADATGVLDARVQAAPQRLTTNAMLLSSVSR